MSDHQGETWTVTTLLRWVTGWLRERGVDAPRLDGELLLAEALGVERLTLFLDPHRPLTGEELGRFKALLKRRGAREPVAYILGRRAFWKHDFRVSPGVLIPRPDSERLVEGVLERFPRRDAPLTLLEVGVGSGALICSLLAEYPQARGVGIDLAPAPLACTRDNARQLEVAQRLSLLRGDLLDAVAPGARFPLILSNPPYVSTGEYAALEPEVRDYEPFQALLAGPEGLDIYRRLVPQGAARLLPGGWLLVEIGHTQGEAVSALFRQAGLASVTVLKDYGQRPRVVAGQRPPAAE